MSNQLNVQQTQPPATEQNIPSITTQPSPTIQQPAQPSMNTQRSADMLASHMAQLDQKVNATLKESGAMFCGSGTMFRDGKCMISDPGNACGLGTSFDAVTQTCIPSFQDVCGINTHFDQNLRKCIGTTPDQTCGTGTIFDRNTAKCVPANATANCGPGTAFDGQTGRCVVDSATCPAPIGCGAGTKLVGTTCLPA